MKVARFSRLILIGFMALLALATVSPAFAAPPSNDDFDNAIAVTALPFTDTQDTSEATTASDDPDCVGNGPTVWYAFTPTTNIEIEANTVGSNYDTTLSVYTGARGALTQIACNDDYDDLQSRVRFEATANTTYFFMVGAFASGSGGSLTLTVAEMPPPPPPLEINVRINQTGLVNPRTGLATISGQVTCSRPTFIVFYGGLEQKAPRRMVFLGSFYSGVECSGEVAWTAVVYPLPGIKFIAGPASAFVSAVTYDPDRAEYSFAEATGGVLLRGSQ